ncbi:PIG-L deacetylase family protein [Pseudomonas sp. TE3610]
MRSISLFFMPHQDDEFGVFHQIEQELNAGRRVRCIYVTDGSATADPDLRDRESRAVLQKLGVATGDILFIGRKLSITDGQMHRHVGVFTGWLDAFLDDHSDIQTCFVPAWEGGHPDHDLVHAIVIELLAAREHSATAWQYPLYNGLRCSGPFFRAMSALPENGPVERQSIGWRDRLRYIKLCLSYPSQWRSWIGLFPFVGGHYFIFGVQTLQGVNRQRLKERPHQGPLYYEKRGFLDWPTMCTAIKQVHQEVTKRSQVYS